MQRYQLKLFVCGDSASAEAARRIARAIFEQELGGTGELEIIDMLESPESAELYKIIASPTLLKESPPPERRLIGDLSDRERVLEALGLASR
jgi:circadian clock protein KaiB